MNIAILGAKIIGSTLARKWAQAGHSLMFGVRHPENPDVLALAQELRAQVGTLLEAITFGSVVVFAIPGNAVEETLQLYGTALADKIVIDTTNRVGQPVLNNVSSFANHAPHAQLFRAFSTLGWENFENPSFAGIPADLFYCGLDSPARQAVEKLIADVGLLPVYVGDLDKVQIVDNLASLWFALAFEQKKGRQIAFKLLTRN
jgi:predicted dinucleotide-binding enzyme